jgi:hypothetical protein
MVEPIHNKDGLSPRANKDQPNQNAADTFQDESIGSSRLGEVSDKCREGWGVNWEPTSTWEWALVKDLQKKVREYAVSLLAEHNSEAFGEPLTISRLVCLEPRIHLMDQKWHAGQGRWYQKLEPSCRVEAQDSDGNWLLLGAEGIERYNAPVVMDAWLTEDPGDDDSPVAIVPRYSFKAFAESWENLKARAVASASQQSCELVEAIEDALAAVYDPPVDTCEVDIHSYEFGDGLGKAEVTTAAGTFAIECGLDEGFQVTVKARRQGPDADLLKIYNPETQSEWPDVSRPLIDRFEHELAENQKHEVERIIRKFVESPEIEIRLIEPRLLIDGDDKRKETLLAFLCVMTDEAGRYYLLNQNNKVEVFNHPVASQIFCERKDPSDYDFNDLYSPAGYEEAVLKAMAALRVNCVSDSEIAYNIAEEIANLRGCLPSEISVAGLEEIEKGKYQLSCGAESYTVSLSLVNGQVGINVDKLEKAVDPPAEDAASTAREGLMSRLLRHWGRFRF